MLELIPKSDGLLKDCWELIPKSDGLLKDCWDLSVNIKMFPKKYGTLGGGGYQGKTRTNLLQFRVRIGLF